MRFCPSCGNAGMRYKGIDDGFGAYGNMICDVYECAVCGYEESDDCIEDDEEGSLSSAIKDADKGKTDHE